MGEKFNIVTVKNEEAYVTIDTLVKFSGNVEYSVKELIGDNIVDIGEFSLGGETPESWKSEKGNNL